MTEYNDGITVEQVRNDPLKEETKSLRDYLKKTDLDNEVVSKIVAAYHFLRHGKDIEGPKQMVSPMDFVGMLASIVDYQTAQKGNGPLKEVSDIIQSNFALDSVRSGNLEAEIQQKK